MYLPAVGSAAKRTEFDGTCAVKPLGVHPPCPVRNPSPPTDTTKAPESAPDAPLTVNELILAYFKFARTLSVKHGEPTSERGCVKQVLRPVRQLSGSTPAAEHEDADGTSSRRPG